jgi:DNA repair protein RAD51
MTTEEIEESQAGIEDGGMGGPGAPTPLSALEVLLLTPRCIETDANWSCL